MTKEERAAKVAEINARRIAPLMTQYTADDYQTALKKREQQSHEDIYALLDIVAELEAELEAKCVAHKLEKEHHERTWLSRKAERAKVAELEAKINKLETICFTLGAMDHAPCFVCGYSGEGYYQPGKHKCAKRHHMECET